MKARLALLAAISAVVGLNACGDPTNLQASLPTAVDTLSVFALTGTPAAYPSGLAILQGQPVRVDGLASFDVAFDITPSGDAIMYPVKLVVAAPGTSRPVGLQRVAGLFEAINTAPSSGYELDSAMVMTPGSVVVVQSAHNASGDLCQFALSPNIFAKVVVDSVNTDSRLIFFKLGIDPNCGFRSFAIGIPTS
jgi:hypothetical protein